MDEMTVTLLPFILLVIVSHIMLCHLIIPCISKNTNIKMFKQLKVASDNMVTYSTHTLILLLLSFAIAYFILIAYDMGMSENMKNENDDLHRLLNYPSVIYNQIGRGNNPDNPFSQFMNKVIR